jgi:hypothetical protein
MDKTIEWMEEIVQDVPSNKFLFKVFKFFLGRRKKGISYKELYIIYTNIYNFKKYDEHDVKEEAVKAILEIYYYNNGKYPL